MLDITSRANLQPIADEIWRLKYRLKKLDGSPVDSTVEDTWWRVARALASPRSDRPQESIADEYFDVLSRMEFLPGGRILAGAGSGLDVTLFNCYVMGRIDDSLDGIFAAVHEAALTMQQGGGIGMDFSTLRPEGAPVHRIGARASGPLSFMDCWDAMCKTIMSAGTRRGAMMGVLRCDHPDIEKFVDAKRDERRFRNFNLSVLVTDAFMEAVRADDGWDLAHEGVKYRRIQARDLWQRIMRSTYDVAEPGVIFIDRMNRRNNLGYCETIYATNPCGEQPLPPYGACLLGSVNLPALVEDPFSPAARIEPGRLADVVRVAVDMLNSVVDVSQYPLPEQQLEAQRKRRIGLGMTGLADALAMLGFRYGTKEAANTAWSIARCISHAAYDQSIEIAKRDGPFPAFDAEKYCSSADLRSRLTPEILRGIREHGIRNSHLTSIAPTGTISSFAGNVSSGIEPIFALEYERKVLMPDNTKRSMVLEDYAVHLWKRTHPGEPLPTGVFVTAQELRPEEHLLMQAAVQEHVDSAVSKTVNVPESISFEDFVAVYDRAYDHGLKGCTTYRPNPTTGSVLSVAPSAPPAPARVVLPPPPERGEELPGSTYKLRWPGSDHAIYVTINDLLEDGQRRPFEIFINSKNMEHYAWTVALTRMVSAVFRRGGDVSFVVEELKAVFDPRGGQWMDKRYVPSLLAAIGGVIERHMRTIGFMDAPITEAVTLEDVRPGATLTQCPKCGAAAVTRQEGCESCVECDYSRCG